MAESGWWSIEQLIGCIWSRSHTLTAWIIILFTPNLNAPQQSYEYTEHNEHDEFHNIPLSPDHKK